MNLPDGRVQTVTYTADEYGGFVADVKYEGEAVYPPEPAEGYGNSYKSKYLPKHSAKYDWLSQCWRRTPKARACTWLISQMFHCHIA